MSADTSIGGPRADFPSTSWTLIRKAQGPSRESLERLVYLYWKPAFYYIRAAGRRSVEDAKDLTQGFFTRLVERRDWERLSPELGSFRGFLKRGLKNFLIDAARRDEARRPSGALLFRFGECRDDAGPVEDPEAEFDRQWTRTLLDDSIRALEDRLKAEGSGALMDVFRLYCLPGDPGDSTRLFKGGGTYADVAAKLGFRESDVRKRLSRCREVLREIVLERIREYSGDEAEAAAEFRRIVGG